MRRTPAVLALLLAVMAGAAPKARISGPATAEAGQRVLLEFLGTVSDGPVYLQCEGPESLKPALLYSPDGSKSPPIFGFTVPSKPGVYRFLFGALGVPDGSAAPDLSMASWDVTVTAPGPAPNPNPNPPPGPPPGPGPEPTPTPTPPPPPPEPAYKGDLWGVLIIPASPTPAQAALRQDPTVRKAFAAANASFPTYRADDPDLQTPAWVQALAIPGTNPPVPYLPPVVVWLGSGGKVLKVTNAPDAPAVIQALKSIRGN